MSFCKPWRYAVLALCLVVVACGPLPKPFRTSPAGGAEHPLIAMQDSAGIVVAPLGGAPQAVAGPMAEIMAAALRREGIPATTGSALKDAYLLEGQVGPARLSNGAVPIHWTLSDAKGVAVETLTTQHLVLPGAWRDGAPVMLEALAAAAAPRIARILQASLPPAMVARDPPTLGVVGVEGAPGNGNTALRVAFDAVLRNAGLPLVADPGSAAVQIFGTVRVTPLGDTRATVAIEWVLRDAKGGEIAVLNQSNAISRERIDDQWGSLAYDVTGAMVGSVAGVLRAMADR